ncbi:MAG TPA: 50S ribosomal protein L5 [Candidatus Omnitrophica bacterium]|nr:50S ribosomal protein L5 [Candidatus Omnitrophota bacterium]
MDPKTQNRLKEKYITQVKPAMMSEFSYKNIMQVPKLVKIVINMGVGEAINDIKIMDQAVSELGLITGQHPVVCRAKKAISNFKIREGQPVGCKVTLRKRNMYEFFDRLVNVTLPRIRDFRGVSKSSFDQNGNYSMGLKEQIIFPEIEYDKNQRIQGMDITIVTTANTQKEAKSLLRLLGMPFKTEKQD